VFPSSPPLSISVGEICDKDNSADIPVSSRPPTERDTPSVTQAIKHPNVYGEVSGTPIIGDPGQGVRT
jgi:hypothetical protein